MANVWPGKPLISHTSHSFAADKGDSLVRAHVWLQTFCSLCTAHSFATDKGNCLGRATNYIQIVDFVAYGPICGPKLDQ